MRRSPAASVGWDKLALERWPTTDSAYPQYGGPAPKAACPTLRLTVSDCGMRVAERHRLRGGFTLIEVLAVLAISGMIVMATFGAIHTQTKLQSTGQSQVERSLIRKGVFDDLTSDLRSTLRPATQRTAPPAPQLPSLLQPTSDFSEQVLDLPQLPRAAVRFYGESNFLVIELSQPSARFHPHQSAATQTPSRSQQVLWFCNSGDVRRVPLQRDRDRLHHALVNAERWSHGLTRVEIPLAGGQSALTSRTLTPQTGHWSSIAPEIESIKFRYFDGQNWHRRWDEHALERIPRAVEVTTVSAMAGTQSFLVRLPQGE